MKKTKTILATVALSVILTACATTQPAGNSAPAESVTKQEKAKKHNDADETPEQKFIKSLSGISIQTASSPKEITNGKAFAAPFIFTVKNKNGEAVSDFPVTISYPAAKSAEGLTFATKDLISDENGNITFEAEKMDFAANAKVKAYPTPISDNANLIESLKPFTAEADWKVKSNIASKGAVLFIWDFNEKDRPVNNSTQVQGEFRGRGITQVGNGPINETSYIGKPKSLYKDTYDIIGGNTYGYLIYGTIKFEQPVTPLEDESGYFCVMKAEIEAVTMKNGTKVYSSVISYESKGKNWNECVSKGKDKLAELIVNDIVYGL